jgi:glycosyltransferase involved in cell wall biosynthesis
MKIGICVRTWGEKGGIGVYTRSIVQHILRSDRKNEYALFYQNHAHMGAFRHLENVREVYVPALGKLMWDQWSMPRIAEHACVDVIFHTKFAVPLLTKRKTVMVLHGTERFIYPQFHRGADMCFFKTIYPQYLRRASLILAVSERGRQDIIERLQINPDNIKTVHLAADPVFQLVKDEDFLARIRNTYRLPKHYLLFVGLIYPGKNVGRLFKAFARARKELDVNLVIAGGYRWKYKSDLQLISKLGLARNVLFPGHVPHEDLVAFYNLAEAVVFPSFYESFPAIPLEAMACGCPVVTSPTGGTPEAAGDAALYVDPNDESGLSEAILRIATEPKLRSELREKGFQNVKRFSWEKTARATLDCLESVQQKANE